jgi:tripartite-type tricarboxylate transporter receptor subunit TctC
MKKRPSYFASMAALFVAAAAHAQTGWPDRPIRFLVPFTAGSGTDVVGRLVGEPMSKGLGQPVVIENKPGAGGNIGIAAVTGSPADGYTIGSATVGHFSINQYLYGRMPFDPEKDFVPVTLTWDMPNVMVVASDHVPARTLEEFVAWAKTRGRISVGSPGVGTTPHLSGVLFSTRTGINATHVPFRGAAQTIPAMLSGDVTYAIDNLASYMSTIEGGKLRALAVTSAQRWPTLPNVPTMAEAGMKDFVVTSWAGFVVPAGTPRPVIERLARAQKEIAADADVQRRFIAAGARILSSTPEEANAKAVQERPMWREMVRVSGARAESQ